MAKHTGGSDDATTALRPRSTRPSIVTARFTVGVVDGPDRGSGVLLGGSDPSRVLVGQSPMCELRLSDPMVSRRHASLEVGSDGLRITDLGSKNGTFVGGVRVIEAVLGGGEMIQAGNTALRVERAGDVGVPLPLATSFGRVTGASAAMRMLYPKLERLAQSTVPLIIEGETGTGKEVLAESIHEEGPRASGPFVVFDCTAVPPNLLESALFGHEKGAFTGANETRVGVFEEAHGGTLLIDEIGDLDVALQAKLLRALERSEVKRLGGRAWIKVDVRIVAATRRDLDKLVQDGLFRDDLFFRLGVARVELPPLRKREGDVELLAEYFWTTLSRGAEPFPPDFLPRFAGYAWPGNLRELHNAVASRLALGDPATLVPSFRPIASPPRPNAPEGDIDRVLALDLPLPRARHILVEEFDRRYVQRVLERHGGNVGRAAAASGIARRYFQLLRARRAAK
jgi:transcriptional regulator with PAS, ATPase and Fis domain